LKGKRFLSDEELITAWDNAKIDHQESSSKFLMTGLFDRRNLLNVIVVILKEYK